MTIDDRAFMMQAACFMTVKASVRFIYPRLIALHNVDPQTSDFPQMRRCSVDKFTEDGAYLLGNFQNSTVTLFTFCNNRKLI